MCETRGQLINRRRECVRKRKGRLQKTRRANKMADKDDKEDESERASEREREREREIERKREGGREIEKYTSSLIVTGHVTS